LWRDRLLISLAPDAVAFARVTGGPQPGILAKQAFDCDPAFGAEPWQGAAAALAAAAGPLRGERLNVTVVLSNHFVRYAIVPFDAAVANPDEELALARFHFAKVHGERARSWDVRLSEGPHGAARLASAVDAELIQAIRACFPPQGKARLVSAQPYLMSAFNRWRGTIADAGAWLLLVEPQRTCLALYAARAWAAAQTVRGEFPGPDSWAELLDRQQLRADVATATRTVLVHAPGGHKPVAGEAHGWSFRGATLPPLDGFLPLEDGRLAMALTAR
jgi:hypothetical protein